MSVSLENIFVGNYVVGNTIGFTGTSDGLTPVQEAMLSEILTHLFDAGNKYLRSGDCIGADNSAATIWDSLNGINIGHPPDNDKKRAFFNFVMMCPTLPYLERNHYIVDTSRLLVACPKEETEQLRSGTWATIRYAKKKHKPIIIIWPTGNTEIHE